MNVQDFKKFNIYLFKELEQEKMMSKNVKITMFRKGVLYHGIQQLT